MGHPLSTAMIGRTVVIGGYLVAIAVAGRPAWLALLFGVLLALVWMAPLVLTPPRRSTVLRRSFPMVEPNEAGPT